MSAAGKPEPLRRRLTAPTIDPDIGASELTEHDDDDDEAVATPPKQTNWAATLIAGGSRAARRARASRRSSASRFCSKSRVFRLEVSPCSTRRSRNLCEVSCSATV